MPCLLYVLRKAGTRTLACLAAVCLITILHANLPKPILWLLSNLGGF